MRIVPVSTDAKTTEYDDDDHPKMPKSGERKGRKKLTSTDSTILEPDWSHPGTNTIIEWRVHYETWLLDDHLHDDSVLAHKKVKETFSTITKTVKNKLTGEVISSETRFAKVGDATSAKSLQFNFNQGKTDIHEYIGGGYLGGEVVKLWFWEDWDDHKVSDDWTSDYSRTQFGVFITVNLPEDVGKSKPDPTPPPSVEVRDYDTPIGQPNLVQVVTLPGLQYAGRNTETEIDNEYAVIPRDTVTQNSWISAKIELKQGQIITGSELNHLTQSTLPPNQKFYVENISIASVTEAEYLRKNFPTGAVIGHNKVWLPMEYFTVSFKPLKE